MLIDSHCHPYMADFEVDRPAMFDRARQAGVTTLVAVGYDLDSSREAVAMAEARPDVYACVALHPHHAAEMTPAALEALRSLARQPRVVAVGEIGLDFHRDLAPRELQRAAFRAQLRLAAELRLPVVIHDREAHPEVMELLAEEGDGRPAVVLHCFSGDLAMAETAWGRGYYTSLAGPLTYKNAHALRELARVAPPDRLLIETDAPYLPPEPFRGRRNEPAHLARIAETLAGLREMPLAEIARLTAQNTRRALRLPPAEGGAA